MNVKLPDPAAAMVRAVCSDNGSAPAAAVAMLVAMGARAYWQGEPRMEEPEELEKTKSMGHRAAGEIQWRVEQTWAHFQECRKVFFSKLGKATRALALDSSTRAAIIRSLHEYDAGLLDPETREDWLEHSITRAAGAGIFLDPWCTATAPQNHHASGGRRYLDSWRPWRSSDKGKPPRTQEFAELAFQYRERRRAKQQPPRQGVLGQGLFGSQGA